MESWAGLTGLSAVLPRWATLAGGVAGFFRLNPLAFLGWQVPLTPERASYYSTAPLRDTLAGLIDAARLQAGTTRLTVGAANVRTGEMRYFDSRDLPLGLPHVMASGALPPAFPAVRIEGELWWDGGILSNTPVECVFDDNPQRDSLVFAVHIWNPAGPGPEIIAQVLHRQKDLQYASRAASHIKRLQQMHRLRHVINALTARLPAEGGRSRGAGAGRLWLPHSDACGAVAGTRRRPGRPCQGHRLQPRRHPRALGGGPRRHAARPWEEASDPLEGFVLHELRREVMPVAG